ncbi:MAG: DUF2807 domain-containing protein [Lentimicrobiaceae bacterium]|nr:DUF2807 domain-containing protein [Lentimicrobiaceae bacterium]MCB9024411.1 DUF2807 domain-containing protein [Lentimicrobiaceae bacterium]MCO5265641.1 DUF2807 domain-containing protein [Lentimicrobium sp.]
MNSYLFIRAYKNQFLFRHQAIFKLLIFIISLTFITFNFTSCTGESLDDCYTSTGPQITEERPCEAFKKIELYNNVNLILIPGNEYQIRVEAGKHIIDAIKTEIKDSTLTIKNTLKCNWVRNYEKELTVYATIPRLEEIRYEGSGDINTQGQLTLDSLKVNIWGGSGSFNFDVNINKLNLAMHYGTVDFQVKGMALITSIYANSYGPFLCSNLISNIVYIRNNGSNNCYVHARHILEVTITSVGDIYYSGNPYQISADITGSGKLIKAD